eukprot:TRINITY_DN756_c0_g1_i2.p1 TRINITY_DN756_c0_g1~~TRINITY_DN756_c0_g1_i2.p1  ORF type:complete len:317 (+),score=64.00 TRINITY_DN756_c0_g1_i2:124-1074(+)
MAKSVLYAVVFLLALYGVSAEEDRRLERPVRPLFGPGIRLRGGSIFQVARPQPQMLQVMMDGPRLSFSASEREDEAREAMEGPTFNMATLEPETDPIMEALNDWMSRKTMVTPLPLAMPLMMFGPRRPFMLNDPVMDLIRLRNLRNLHDAVRRQSEEGIRSEEMPRGEFNEAGSAAAEDRVMEVPEMGRIQRPVVSEVSEDVKGNEEKFAAEEHLAPVLEETGAMKEGFEYGYESVMRFFLEPSWFLALGVVASVLLMAGFIEMLFCSGQVAEEPSVTVLSAPGLESPLLQTYTVTYVNEAPTSVADEAGVSASSQ